MRLEVQSCILFIKKVHRCFDKCKDELLAEADIFLGCVYEGECSLKQRKHMVNKTNAHSSPQHTHTQPYSGGLECKVGEASCEHLSISPLSSELQRGVPSEANVRGKPTHCRLHQVVLSSNSCLRRARGSCRH